MSGNAFDAVVLLVADGFVAVGRVLGGFRRRCDTERRADAVDALNALEDSQDGLEPGDLSAFGLQWPTKADKDRAFGELKDSLDRITAAELGEPAPRWSCAECGRRMNSHVAAGSPTKRGLFCSARCADDAPETALDRPSPELIASMINMQSASPVRSAAVTVPAADNTPDHLEAAWHYHTGAVGYAAMRTGGVEWFCEGCNWHGPTKQAHARHRFQVLADMKNATERIQEQLAESTNACVVDGCDFWWHTYEQLNSHSRQMHLEPNPLPAGGFRYPGADHVGDFTWHHVPTHRIQEQLGGAS